MSEGRESFFAFFKVRTYAKDSRNDDAKDMVPYLQLHAAITVLSSPINSLVNHDIESFVVVHVAIMYCGPNSGKGRDLGWMEMR